LEDSIESFSEEISSKNISKALSDSLPIADSEAEAISLTLSDDIAIAEEIDILYIVGRFLGDDIGFSEELVFSVNLAKTETEPILEAISNSYTLSLSDDLGITEQSVATKAVVFFDSISFSETTSKFSFKHLFY